MNGDRIVAFGIAKRRLKYLVALLFSSPFVALANPNSSFLNPVGASDFGNFASTAPSNSISPKELGLFWTTWPLVTARFRSDKEQIRLTYANQIAFDAMRRGDREYPDGSIFTKIVFKGKKDDSFPMSFVPRDLIRIQVMRKSKKDYPTTDGWGYAIFGAPFSTDAQKWQTSDGEACHSCHRIVATSDFIFSEPMMQPRRTKSAANGSGKFESQFKSKKFSTLSPKVQSELTQIGFKQAHLMFYEMPLFVGSLAESVASMAAFAAKNHKAYLIIDREAKFYALASNADEIKGKCMDAVKVSVAILDLASSVPSQKLILNHGISCHGFITWEN